MKGCLCWGVERRPRLVLQMRDNSFRGSNDSLHGGASIWGIYDEKMQDAASTWHTIDGLCHDSERFSKYGHIVESCKYKCPDLTKRDRPYGLTCLEKVRPYCVYLCHMPEGHIKLGMEQDGTPCRFFRHEGVCQNGLCLLDKPRKERPAKGDGDKEGGPVTPKADESNE
ncbi:hypothetical protein HPB51_000450 [Rhipicephalus microplus]|uniref:Uncharacterized protein n=1 Tax=Rhipicephalus microplus TaxID=6941 RepID=A0A9J6EVN2_RHIMP|nr:hypothetical protein HPB51_000450 [Rhipicephalus microplus]